MKTWTVRSLCCRSVLTLLLGVCLAGLVPQSAKAAELSWSPLYVNFGQVPIGSTGYQTLTLTNEDLYEPIIIDRIEFTFNQAGAFGWSTVTPLEAVIPAGGSMEVELSFTPNDTSFAMADMWIYNSSDNAPSLYMGLLGEGTMGDPCYPLPNNCDGCTDIQTDIDNCGSCFNVCLQPEHATATCTDGVCGFVCDEGYEPSDGGCGPPAADKTALELLEELQQFVWDSYLNGSLTGVSLGNGDSNEFVFVHKFYPEIYFALDTLTDGQTKAACRSLNYAQLRCDSGWPAFIFPPDMVDGPARQEVHDRIIEIINKMDDCEVTEPITPPGH